MPQDGSSCVNSLHRFRARVFRNTSESLHLYIYMLRLLLPSYKKGKKELHHVPANFYVLLQGESAGFLI